MRPLTAAEILDGTVALYKAHFRTYLTLGVLLQLPALLASLLFAGFLPILIGDEPPSDLAILLLGQGFLLTFALFGLHGLVVRPILTGAAVHATAGLFYGQRPRIRDALRAGLRQALPLVLTTLLAGLLATLALPVLVLAGLLVLAVITVPVGYIAFLVYFHFYPQVIMVENRGYFEAFRRSFRLVRGHFWRILGIGVVVVIGTALVQGALVLPGAAAFFAVPLLTGQEAMRTVAGIGTAVLGIAAEALMAPVPAIAGTLAYLDLRMRKEGLDIWLAAEGLAAAGARP
ncbi:MAG: hypothetical protein DIU70_005485 [Bacillota bacterium]|nr:MAG: hypothetical protein DIU70_04240 [Bacillota bacterium]